MEIRRPLDKKRRSPAEASVRANGNSFAQMLARMSAWQAQAAHGAGILCAYSNSQASSNAT
jgi:hypothetical protein